MTFLFLIYNYYYIKPISCLIFYILILKKNTIKLKLFTSMLQGKFFASLLNFYLCAVSWMSICSIKQQFCIISTFNHSCYHFSISLMIRLKFSSCLSLTALNFFFFWEEIQACTQEINFDTHWESQSFEFLEHFLLFK